MASHTKPHRAPDIARLPLPKRSDPFIEAARRTIRERRLISAEQTVLVACSGGADSVALAVTLHVLSEHLGFTVRIAHVNHRIRGDVADADARWVATLAEALAVPCHLGSVDVPSLTDRRRGSKSRHVGRAKSFSAALPPMLTQT